MCLVLALLLTLYPVVDADGCQVRTTHQHESEALVNVRNCITPHVEITCILYSHRLHVLLSLACMQEAHIFNSTPNILLLNILLIKETVKFVSIACGESLTTVSVTTSPVIIQA